MWRVVLSLLGIVIVAGCAPSLPLPGGDPASSAASISPAPYRSPFKDFARLELTEPRPWRETNERVRVFGGPNTQMLSDSEDDPPPGAGEGHDHKH